MTQRKIDDVRGSIRFKTVDMDEVDYVKRIEGRLSIGKDMIIRKNGDDFEDVLDHTKDEIVREVYNLMWGDMFQDHQNIVNDLLRKLKRVDEYRTSPGLLREVEAKMEDFNHKYGKVPGYGRSTLKGDEDDS